MEHLQEDVETMATELAFWADERKRYQVRVILIAAFVSHAHNL